MKNIESILTVLFCFLSFPLIGQGQNEEFPIGQNFIPAGYMGCPDDIELNSAWKIDSYSEPFCFRISYISTCPVRFAGIHWTNKADINGANWGQYPGENFSRMKYTKLKFFARGENGGEVVEFGAGGIDKPGEKYKDSFKALIKGRIVLLEADWKEYEIDLTNKDLSSVISGFYWVASWNDNSSGITFYLDDIRFVTE